MSVCLLLIDKAKSKEKNLYVSFGVKFVYYESIKWDLKTRPIYECRCDERLETKTEESTRLVYTGLLGKLEHLKIQTRLTDEMFVSVMGEWDEYPLFLLLIDKAKGKWGIYTSHIHWVTRGTGTPKDKDEVNRRDDYECDGWVCVLEVIGSPSMLRLMLTFSTFLKPVFIPHFWWLKVTVS